MHIDNTDEDEQARVCVYDNGDPETVRNLYIVADNELVHQTDCVLTVSEHLFIGTADGPGAYSISGSTEGTTLTAEDVVLGGDPDGEGLFYHDGGTCTFGSLAVSRSYPVGEASTYELRGGVLEITGSETVGQTGSGVFSQYYGGSTHPDHKVHGSLMVGGPSGWGVYLVEDGQLTVGWGGENVSGDLEVDATGSGGFVHSGVGVVTVRRNAGQGGRLLVGCEGGYDSLYVLDENGLLNVETEIQVGNGGRFEWLSSGAAIDTPKIEVAGTLAMGFDFSVAELAEGEMQEEGGVCDLSNGTLEITNGAAAEHAGGFTLEVGRLSIGSSDDPPDGEGTYTIVGFFEGPAVVADALHVAIADDGTLNVGSTTVATDAELVLTGLRAYDGANQASVYFGEKSSFKVRAPEGQTSTCTMTMTYANAAAFVLAVKSADAENVDGLSVLNCVFPGGGESDRSYYCCIEAAGAEVVGGGLPQNEDFSAANFVIGKLVVGDEDADDDYGPVVLSVSDEEDNRENGPGNEAVYVKTLTITKGGTFDLTWGGIIYYLNGDQEPPKRLYMGDATLDGAVDGADYTVWCDNYLETGTVWASADFNGDRVTDGADYSIWADNYPSGGGGRDG